MYSVSSSFLSLSAGHSVEWLRRFMIGTSDYSHLVLKWPSLKKRWDDLRPEVVAIDLSNNGGAFNFLEADPTKMRTTSTIELGLIVAGGSAEYFTAFAGTIDAAQYQNGRCSLSLADKFKVLSDRKVGDTTTPESYTSSAWFVHTMAWHICTSHGGLSAIASTSNPDIDYASFTSWSAVFSADNVRVMAEFTGQTPLEALRKLGSLTQSAIFIENNKLKFVRFSLVGSDSATLNDANVLDSRMTLDDRSLVNRAVVGAAYDTTSRSFGISVSDVHSGSVVSYGLREDLRDDRIIWLTDSNSALNLAQRTVLQGYKVRGQHSVKTTLAAAPVTIGDTLTFIDAQVGVSSSFRVMGEVLDMDRGTKTFEMDTTQYFSPFILDSSVLDGSDILT